MPSLWAFGFRCIFASLWLQANVDRSKSFFLDAERLHFLLGSAGVGFSLAS